MASAMTYRIESHAVWRAGMWWAGGILVKSSNLTLSTLASYQQVSSPKSIVLILIIKLFYYSDVHRMDSMGQNGWREVLLGIALTLVAADGTLVRRKATGI